MVRKKECEVETLSSIQNDNSELEPQPHNKQAIDCDNTMLEKIRRKIISEKEYEEKSVNQEYKSGIKKFEPYFLETYGIKVRSPEEDFIREKYQVDKVTSTLKGMNICIDSTNVTIYSVQSKKDNSTYYLLVRRGE